ncbi:hypothetical protein [Lacrimispora sp.]|uniref:hypothetical protein n=1 Tax=Lacrimispora sp. TaxID=2719234 RepID=UPI002FDABAEA
MESNTYEQEIDLKDLIFFICRKWRTILLVAFIFTILLGGYKAGKMLINQRNEELILNLKEEYEDNLEKYYQEKDGYQRDIESLTASITYQEIYKENSLLLKIDPYHKGVATIDIFVKMPEDIRTEGMTVTTVDPADGIVRAYSSAIKKGTFLEGLSKQKAIDLIYLNELITVKEDYNSNMVSISIASIEEAEAEEILNKILDSMESISAPIQEKLGQHSIAIMNEDIHSVTDSALVDYQKQKIKSLTDTNKSLKDAESALKDLKKPEQPVVLSRSSILKEGVKYGILGGGVGAFLIAFGAFLIFLMDGKLKIDSDLKKRFGIKILGSFTEVKKKKAFLGIDLWLDRLEGKDDMSDDLVYDMIAVNIKNFINEGRSVFLTGTVEEEVLRKIAKQLKDRLPQLSIEYGSYIAENIMTLQQLPQYDEVVLVETRNKSQYRIIEKEIEMVVNLKKDIIGYIILNSDESCIMS